MIDNQTVQQLSDPINTFLQFLKHYKWKHILSTICLESDDLKETWLKIDNEIYKLINSYSIESLNHDEYAFVWTYDYSQQQYYVSHICIASLDFNHNIFFSYINDKTGDNDEIRITPNMFSKDFLEKHTLHNRGKVSIKIIDKIKQEYNL